LNIESLSSFGGTIGGGFLGGILIGYALKKVVRLAAVVVGLFFSGIAYLEYQQILNINWNKLQAASQNTLSTLAGYLHSQSDRWQAGYNDGWNTGKETTNTIEQSESSSVNDWLY